MRGIEFQWSDDFAIDHGEIDAEHQCLLELANRVLALGDPKHELLALKQAVTSLFDYVANHFAHEEVLMASIGFPELAEHRARHQEIVSRLSAAVRGSVSVQELQEDLQEIMFEWVIRHILVEDSQIAPYVREASMAEATS